MEGIFQPEPRQLTEHQFITRVNGTHLTNVELNILRRACGLPYKEEEVANVIMADRIAANAWRKVLGKMP